MLEFDKLKQLEEFAYDYDQEGKNIRPSMIRKLHIKLPVKSSNKNYNNTVAKIVKLSNKSNLTEDNYDRFRELLLEIIDGPEVDELFTTA